MASLHSTVARRQSAVDNNGKFNATFETEQYKAATAYVRDLYAAGIFHPDSTNYNTISARDAFQAASVGLVSRTYAQIGQPPTAFWATA